MTDCLFCNIANGNTPATIVYQDDDVVAFEDINPKAPKHMLIIPRRHIATVNDLSDADAAFAGKLILTARDLAVTHGIADGGYRILMNCNQHGGQEVYHIHLHLLGGRQLTWPPG